MSDRNRPRKILVEVIDDCGMCHYIDCNEDGNDYCGHNFFRVPGNDINDQKIGAGPMIPEWCPLESADKE